MKISIITVCRNAELTLQDALESIARQKLPGGVELEHVVVDGASSDSSPEIIRRHALVHPVKYISEPDKGLYDAMNKGIAMCTGDVVGILNADDVTADDSVMAKIAEAFSAGDAPDIVYGDVRFTHREIYGGVEVLRSARTVRYCTGRFFRRWMFRFAVFPAHPATFVRRGCFAEHGLYSLDYPIAADFEMMLRLIYINRLKTRYIPLCTTVMRMGGVSTNGFKAMYRIREQDMLALSRHGVRASVFIVYLKYLAKVFGYVFRK